MKPLSFKLLACFFCFFLMTCRVAKVAKAPVVSVKKPESTAPVSGEKFSEHVRTTEFQTPEQEQAAFHLPPGFEITLFASEPDISKPINMEFDAAGRLWVSQSSEYPIAAGPGGSHDRITVLEDTDGNGKADKFTHFADDLNIPIGITPVKGGAIGYSIPNLYRFTDTDGDGTYDTKKVLFGPFGHQDTHGMVSNLIRGYDGWIHACHGFTNTSTIAGTDGDSITMISGNTFRFKEDGSRVEQTTYGRVNPFGYAFDEWGYLYSVDCHSKPIYQLIKGAEYPHFGKKSPAIGFAPEMMSYELGSTALSGLVYYIGNQFPPEYQNSFYNGDVVTCRINRNNISWDGSSPVSKRLEDFLVSSDPWFRPVNIKMGPDGAMYVADFYNRIIGHYEVPLNHPGRDRLSGRIWKISYVGDGKQQLNSGNSNWSKASLKELIAHLNYPQLTTRMMIANQVVDRYPQEAIVPLTKTLNEGKLDNKATVQTLWILYRLNALPDMLLEKALNSTDPLVQMHALRVLGEKSGINAKQRALALGALHSSNANVQRMAAEVAAAFPQTDNVKLLLALYDTVSSADNHLKYTALIGIRQNLRNEKVMRQVAAATWNESQWTTLIKVLPDVPSEEAATFALQYLKTHQLPQEQLVRTLEYIGRYVSSEPLDEAIAMIQKRFPANEDAQFDLYQTIRKGIAQKGVQASTRMKEWGLSLAKTFLQGDNDEAKNWWNAVIDKSRASENPWTIVNRSVVEGYPATTLLWSESNRWTPTGILHSPQFRLPARLSMNIFDNDVYNSPAKTGVSKNVVRIWLVPGQQVVGEYRSNTAEKMGLKDIMQQKQFDLSAYQGQTGYIEVVDSVQTGSIGIGAIDPAVVSMPIKGPAEIASRQVKAAEIIADYKSEALEPSLLQLLNSTWADQKARASAASALMTIAPERNAQAVSEAFTHIGVLPELRQQLAMALGLSPTPAVLTTLRKGLVGTSGNVQLTVAGVLVKSSQGISQLLEAARAGDIDVDLLDEVSIKERLSSNILPPQQKQLDQLMAAQAGREDRKQIIAARLASFNPSSVTVENGKQLFIQNCSMCHQIKGNGGMIGPQLDGIGNWGQKALTEKILNPNGNISEAFRNYNITLKNGKALSGLYRREEGEVLIFANPGGQEFAVAKNDIKEKAASKYTLMPDHFRNTISKTDFDALLKFLLGTKE